jgi:hypothetical protein
LARRVARSEYNLTPKPSRPQTSHLPFRAREAPSEPRRQFCVTTVGQSHPAVTSSNHFTRSSACFAHNSFAGPLYAQYHACLPDFDGYINCPAAVYHAHDPPRPIRYTFLDSIDITACDITRLQTSPQYKRLLPRVLTANPTPTVLHHNFTRFSTTKEVILHSRPTWRTRTLSTL